MPIRVRYITDPACSASWAAEPKLRRLMSEFDAELDWTLVMGGLARDWTGTPGAPEELVKKWLRHAGQSGMPFDPRLWTEAPLASSYPACMAVKAASEQGTEAAARYLRALRTALMCFRRKLDTPEPLVEEARGVGLDVERFRVDLGSHAIVETFGADLEEARRVPEQAFAEDVKESTTGVDRVVFPAVSFEGSDGEKHWIFGNAPYEDWKTAAMKAGATVADGSAPGVLEALGRFGQMAGAEIEAVSGLAEVPAQAELWRLATEWKVKPTRVLTGHLWDLTESSGAE